MLNRKQDIQGWIGLCGLAVLSAAVIQACGSGNSGPMPYPITPSVTACSVYGCSSLAPQVEKQQSFNSCLIEGGSYIQINGSQVCRSEMVLRSDAMPIVPFPELSSSNPANPRARQTNIHLFTGDRVTLMANGKQGRGFFKCTGADVRGMTEDEVVKGTVIKKGELVNGADGQPAGLYGVLQNSKSRSAAFLIGRKYSLGVVPSDSILLVGWNPIADEKTDCVDMDYLEAEVTRCVDAAGNSYTCPF